MGVTPGSQFAILGRSCNTPASGQENAGRDAQSPWPKTNPLKWEWVSRHPYSRGTRTHAARPSFQTAALQQRPAAEGVPDTTFRHPPFAKRRESGNPFAKRWVSGNRRGRVRLVDLISSRARALPLRSTCASRGPAPPLRSSASRNGCVHGFQAGAEDRSPRRRKTRRSRRRRRRPSR